MRARALIGINNRNLRTFVTRLEHTLDLLPELPADCCLVSESGIRTRADMMRLEAAGVRAVLIGETFMRPPTSAKNYAICEATHDALRSAPGGAAAPPA